MKKAIMTAIAVALALCVIDTGAHAKAKAKPKADRLCGWSLGNWVYCK